MRNFLENYKKNGGCAAKDARMANVHTVRLAKAVAWSNGRADLAEDLNQEIWIRMAKVAESYDPVYPAESYILGWMRRIIMELNRKNMLAIEADESDGDFHECVRVANAVEDQIDRKIALVAIESRLNRKRRLEKSPEGDPMEQTKMGHVPFVNATVGTKAKKTSAPIVPPKRTGPGNPLGPDHLEVRNARIFLDMTQADFAAAIGKPTPTLVSYECGRTQKVPQDVLDRVRDLVKDNGDILPWRARFDGVPVKDILTQWAGRLGCDPDDMVTMAAMTGTTVSTISRWRNGEVVPRLRQLIAYDAIVEKNAQRLKKSEGAMKNLSVVEASPA